MQNVGLTEGCVVDDLKLSRIVCFYHKHVFVAITPVDGLQFFSIGYQTDTDNYSDEGEDKLNSE